MATPTSPATQPSFPKRRKVIALEDATCPPVQQNGSHYIAPPRTNPVVESSGASIPPGEWATYIKALPWKKAYEGNQIKTPMIRSLLEAPAVREPVMRTTFQYDTARLDERISFCTANIESALIQITGDVSPEECTRCLKDRGPWSQCIRFNDIQGERASCGNCYWNDQKHLCGFPKSLIDTGRPQLCRIVRYSTSSMGTQSDFPSGDEDRVSVNITAIDELERALLQMQREVSIEDTQNTAIHIVMQSDNAAEAIVAMRPLIPTRSPEQRRAEFDRILGMVNGIKEAGASGRDV